MDGSKHLGAVDVKMVFSYVHGDFGIRIVCCFSFGEYCFSQSRTLLKSYKAFLHLNTRARFNFGERVWSESFRVHIEIVQAKQFLSQVKKFILWLTNFLFDSCRVAFVLSDKLLMNMLLAS